MQGYDKEAAAISGVGSIIGRRKKKGAKKTKKAVLKGAGVAVILAGYQGMDNKADLINSLGAIAVNGMIGGALGLTVMPRSL